MDKTRLLVPNDDNEDEISPCLTVSSRSTSADSTDEDTVQLKRDLGLVRGVALIVGSMIGSGIFISPKGVLMVTKSVGMSLGVWMMCAVVSTLSAMCYAELGTVVPRCGGSYQYILHAYGDLPAFLVSWYTTVVLYPSGSAMVAITLGNYIADYLTPGDCKPPRGAVKLFAISSVMALAFINCASVRWTSRLAVVFSGAKVIALSVIIVTGLVKICQGHTQYIDPSVSFVGTTTDGLSYGTAMYYGFWAYFGWDILNILSEEMINPERNILLAICISIPTVTFIYMLTNISYFTTLSPNELLASSAVAVTFAEKTLGPMAWIIPLGVCISASGNLLSSFLSAPRLSFAAGREGHMFKVMSMVNINFMTPLPAVMLKGILVSLFILFGEFDSILVFSGVISWTIYGASFAALLVLRQKYPRASRPFKVNFLVPVFTTLLSVFMVIAPVISNPSPHYLYILLIFVVGLGVYYVFVQGKRKLPLIDHMTLFLQKLLLVTETTTWPDSAKK